MKDEDKSKERLIRELNDLREQVAEAEYQKSNGEEKYRHLFKNAPAGIYEIDLVNRKFISVNDTMCEMLGYSKEEFLATDPFDMISGESKDHFIERLKAYASGREVPEETEYKVVRKDGKDMWLAIHANYDYDGNIPVKATVVAHDITLRKKMEEKLKKNKEEYAELFENANDIIYTIDFQGNITSINSAATKIYGYSKEEILEVNLKELVDFRYIPIVNKNITRIKKGEIEKTPPLEILTYSRNNFPVWIEVSNRLIMSEGEFVGIQGIARDITERKQAEKAVRESENLYRTIFENSGSAMIIGEQDTNISLVNTEFEILSGYKKEEIEGRKSWTEFIYYEEDMEKMKRHHYWRRTEPGKVQKKYEVKFIDGNGTVKDVVISVAVIPNTKKHVASFLDITELKQYQKKINRLERLNIIGQMAAGIGHELRNPMTTVRGLLQILKSKEGCESYQENFELMIEEMDRTNSIITQFLTLAKDKQVNKEEHNLNSIIETMYPLLHSDAMKSKKNIDLELQEVPNLLLDNNEIRQLLLNLAHNGLEEMPEGGKLTVRTYTEIDEVVLEVEDQGGGVSPGVIEKLGTPFFTTKDNGTGLGLAVCYSIASRHNASLEVENTDQGAKFIMRFQIGY